MTIDIISYTDEQFAKLTEEQLLEVQSAQLKKERLKTQLEENVAKRKNELLKQGIFRSDIFALCKAKLEEQYALEVENLRDSLLFYLRFASKADVSDAGYPLDYSLTINERYVVVRDFYINTYTDPTMRFETFRTDEAAKVYLNEAYSSLYAYLKTFVPVS